MACAISFSGTWPIASFCSLLAACLVGWLCCSVLELAWQFSSGEAAAGAVVYLGASVKAGGLSLLKPS